jgi:RNA polymerase sigma factor (sigma-70 family)
METQDTGRIEQTDATAAVRNYWQELWPYFFGLTRHRQDAEDVVQEAVLKWCQNLRRTGTIPNNEYLRAGGRCSYFSLRRWQTRHRNAPMEENSIQDDGPGPDQIVAQRELLAIVASELAKLPDSKREAIDQTLLQSKSSRQVAAELGSKGNTVRIQKYRTLAEMRRRLGSRVSGVTR